MLAPLAVRTRYRWLITLAFIAFIVVLSLTPGLGRADDSVFSWLLFNTAKTVQKLMHVSVYAALAVLWMWTLEKVESKLLRIFLTLLLTVGLGVVLEVFQTRVPGRYGTFFDVLLNAIGAIAGLLLALLVL